MSNKLNDKPILNKTKISSPKILSPEDTPVRLQKVMEASRILGQSMGETLWNTFVKFVDDFMGKECISGNDALSITTTYITYLLATWIVSMKINISDKDDAGIQTDELINAVMQGVVKIIKTAKITG